MNSKHASLALGSLLFLSMSAIAPDAEAAPAAKSKTKKKAPPAAVAAPPAIETPPAPAPAEAPAAPRAAEPVKDAPAPAPEEGDEDRVRPISVAPLLGYASGALNAGLGIRAGYTFDNHVYVGGTFLHHVGESQESRLLGNELEVSASYLYGGAEGGYELPVGPVVLRPYVGLGMLAASVTTKSGGESDSRSSSSFAVWPGCSIAYFIPKTPAFVGGDTRLVLLTEGGDPSFGAFATGGVRF